MPRESELRVASRDRPRWEDTVWLTNEQSSHLKTRECAAGVLPAMPSVLSRAGTQQVLTSSSLSSSPSPPQQRNNHQQDRSASAPSSEQNPGAASAPTNTAGGSGAADASAGATSTTAAVSDEEASKRRKELRAMFRKQRPKFLRNRLANLNLAQDGLLPVLVERLTEAALLLERGVAPTSHARATGEEVVVHVSPATSPSVAAASPSGGGRGRRGFAAGAVGGGADNDGDGDGGGSGKGGGAVQQGAFAGAADVNDPLRATRHRDALGQFKADLAARAAPSPDEVTAAARKEYMSRVVQHQVTAAHRDMEEHEVAERAAARRMEESAKKIKDDQDRLAREKVARAQAADLARRRRIEMHGGVDPLQPKEKDRAELVAAIREEIEEYSTKQIRNLLALKGLSDRHKVRIPVAAGGSGNWESRQLLRPGLVERLHARLVEERLGPDDDILVNALIVLGMDPSKGGAQTTFTAVERAQLQREVARLTRDKLAKEQAATRALMAQEQALALARLEAKEEAVRAARVAEVERVHRGMEVVACDQRAAIRHAVAGKGVPAALRKDHFASQPNGFAPVNEFLPDDYLESEVERYAKAKARDTQRTRETAVMRKHMPPVNANATAERRKASESHFAPNTKGDFLYGNLVVNESFSRTAHFGAGGPHETPQEPGRYVGPVWRPRPVKPPPKVYSRGEVMSMLFWGVYKGSLEDVRRAIPLVDWNNGLDFAFEVGAGLNHPAAAHGDTALHVAARRGHSRVVRELVNRGADHEVKNSDLMTAYDVVRRVNTSKLKYAKRDAYRKIELLLGNLRGHKMKHVEAWLATLRGAGGRGTAGLEAYAEAFEAKGHDDIHVIAMLTADGLDKLVADVGMTNRSHINRLRKAVAIKRQEVTGAITAEEAAVKVAQLSDARAKPPADSAASKRLGSSPFQDDLLNGNRELQKALRRQRIAEDRAKAVAAGASGPVGHGGAAVPRQRGDQAARCRNWRFRADIQREQKELAGELEAAASATKPSFREIYPVGYDPPDPSDKSGGGYPTLRWSERRNMNKKAGGFR